MNRRDDNYYDDRLQDIKLDEITSSERNKDVLQKFHRGDPNLTNLLVDMRREGDSDDESDDEDETIFTTDYELGTDDLGWLGFYIGRSEHLTKLNLFDLPYHPAELHNEQMDALTRGISRNRSIVELIIDHDVRDVGFRNMCIFVRENNNLRNLDLLHVKPEDESAQHFALMLEQRQSNSLQRLALQDNDLGDEEIEAIAAALSRQASLEELELMENDFGRPGCVALGTTFERWQAPNLKQLVLSYNNIDDAGLQALVVSLLTASNSKHFNCYNHSITAVGLRSLATFFQSEHCCLEEFLMAGVYFGDEGAIALADGLVGNTSIESMTMYIDSIESTHFRTAPLITEVGWSAFSKLLCDASSIRNTYLSNHTLTTVSTILGHERPPAIVENYLELNRCAFDGVNVAMIKILTHHPDLKMEPFFK